jgi:hypothetical protein
MDDRTEPRVTVTLPGGRVVEGHLQARRQDTDGRWWYQVAIDIPATAIKPIEGQDYSRVPTEAADTEKWVLQALRHDTPGERAVVVHKGDCWAAEGRTEPATRDQARIFLREGWATACEACKPEPGSGPSAAAMTG